MYIYTLSNVEVDITWSPARAWRHAEKSCESGPICFLFGLCTFKCHALPLFHTTRSLETIAFWIDGAEPSRAGSEQVQGSIELSGGLSHWTFKWATKRTDSTTDWRGKIREPVAALLNPKAEEEEKEEEEEGEGRGEREREREREGKKLIMKAIMRVKWESQRLYLLISLWVTHRG